jgi:hypothetical protein
MIGRRLVEEWHTVDMLRDGITGLAPAPLFRIERLGVVMAPEPGNPLEAAFSPMITTWCAHHVQDPSRLLGLQHMHQPCAVRSP